MDENRRGSGRHTLASNTLIARATFVIAVVLYGVVIVTHTSEVAGGSDSSGYANEARLIARRVADERITELDRFGLDDSFTSPFTPLGYTSWRPRYATPSYPPGLPMHMALAGVLFGFKHAPFYVSPIAAIAGLILLSLFALRLFRSWWIAIGAGFALALCATYVFLALQTMSDVLTTTWTIAAMAAAWKSRDGDARWAAVAGVSFAIAVWVRPANVILGIAFLFALPWTKKAIAYCAIGGAIFVAPLFVWNAKQYGSPFRTGYGAAGGLFGLSYFPSHSLNYLRWTSELLTPLVMAGAIYSIVRARQERIHLVLALWFWTLFLFYCIFGPYEEWWYTRFLLPGYPAIILSTIYAARAVSLRALALTLLLIGGTGFCWSVHYDLLDMAIGEAIYPDTIRWSRAEIPRDALVIAMQFSGARKYYDNRFSLRYDWLDADRVRVLEQKVPADRWWAIVGEFELEDVLQRTGGRWTKISQLRDSLVLHRDPNGTLSSNSMKGSQ